MITGRESASTRLDPEQVEGIIREGTPSSLYRGKSVLVLTPDGTRTAPLPMMIGALQRVMGKTASRLDFMVALGTHRPLGQAEIIKLYGLTENMLESGFNKCRFLNHRWDLPETLRKVGKIEAREVASLTDGLFQEEIDIDINRNIFDYDLVVILGPVFPHEVAGFSGGNKYLFPGISGGNFLHFFHWVGAIVTCWKIIGRKNNPVRKLVERAAGFVKVKKHCIAMVVKRDNSLAGLFVGSPEETWSSAADLSAQLHIVRKEHPFKLVIGSAAAMYDELWTAGKVMYKLEPVVADGGKLIIHGPHVSALSHTWGKYIEKIGYHVRDFFLAQEERFKDIPRGVLAHSTHVKGLGSFTDGIERPRIEVILATSLPEKTCRHINLGYLNPEEVDIKNWEKGEDRGVLVVRDAGEILYRLTDDPK
jgi:nickel-dependent lactate racemase